MFGTLELELDIVCQLKKSLQNPLCSLKDLSIHKDRQREATLFYTMLYTYINTIHALTPKG
jgi:hypothetical protein